MNFKQEKLSFTKERNLSVLYLFNFSLVGRDSGDWATPGGPGAAAPPADALRQRPLTAAEQVA